MFECTKCGNKRKFVVTENILTSSTFVVDLYGDDNYPLPDVKSNQVSRQYTVICPNCGRVYLYNENDYVKTFIQGFNEEGIIVAVDDIFEKVKKHGKEGYENNNFEENVEVKIGDLVKFKVDLMDVNVETWGRIVEKLDEDIYKVKSGSMVILINKYEILEVKKKDE